MSSLNAAIVILAVLLCSSQVYSLRITVTGKTINYSEKHLLIGKNHVNKSTLLYALCGINGETAQCTVYLKSDVFDDTYAEYSCNATASSRLGKLELLGVELWGAYKALFAWRDLSTSNEAQGELYVETLHMKNCFSSINQFPIDIRTDKNRQEYIITFQNNYIVTFVNERECDNYICKVNVNIHGHATKPQAWISSTNLIHALETIGYSSQNLLISVAEDGDSTADLYLLNGDRYLQSTTALRTVPYNPIKYVALYNLPNGGYLALVCFQEPGTYYRIIQIEADGTEGYYYSLINLQCAHKFRHMTGKFYENGSEEYCLYLFYASDILATKFVSYCFGR